jgi:hypothetical protein
LSLNHIRH